MHGEPEQIDARQIGRFFIEPRGVIDAYAEFALLVAGADLGMSARTDGGIDAQGDVGASSLCLCDLAQAHKLAFGFHIDLEKLRLDGKSKLPVGLADAG